MKIAGWIIEGDPQMPADFVDWGQQRDGAFIVPSFQNSEIV